MNTPAFVELGGREKGEERSMQQQSNLARVAMVIICITLPILAPLYLMALLFYQFCLVEKLSPEGKAGTAIVAVFFSVAWVPYVNVLIFAYDADVNRSCIANVVNGLTPLGLFYIFCIWALWVAFRHFSIADSYEDARDRSHLRHLKQVELVPGLSPEAGDATAVVNNAYDLYFLLKGRKYPFVPLFCLLTVALTVGVVTPSRIFARSGGRVGFGGLVYVSKAVMNINGNLTANCSVPDVPFEHSDGTVEFVDFENQNYTLWVLSTVQYSGIFLVFFASISAVMVGFLHESRLLKNLKLALPDLETVQEWRANAGVGTTGLVAFDRCTLDPSNVTHLRAWDAVRRIAVQELTSGDSVFQSIFAPTVGIMIIACLGCYFYVVLRLMFQHQSIGFFTAPVAVFAGINFVLLMAVFLLARNAQSYFKSHRALIAKISFDISREMDKQLRQRLVSDTTFFKANSRVNEELLSSLVAMRTYMVSNLPRIRLLGVELQHVRWGVVMFLLVNGLMMFFALMIGLEGHQCQN